MQANSNYSACFNRLAFQSKKIEEFQKLVLPIINKPENKDIMQFVLESIIIREASSFEELLNCIIAIASGIKEYKIRKYFQKYGNQETKKQIERGCNLGELSNLARAELSFKDNAKKLERIFNFLFGFSIFPDQSTKDYVLDMILIRNIIVHEGGWPNENHAKQIRHPGAIKISSEVPLVNKGRVVFYKLELTDFRFLSYLLFALSQVVIHVASKLSTDIPEINKNGIC